MVKASARNFDLRSMKKGFGFVGQLFFERCDMLGCSWVMRWQDWRRAGDVGFGLVIICKTILIFERRLLTRPGFGSGWPGRSDTALSRQRMTPARLRLRLGGNSASRKHSVGSTRWIGRGSPRARQVVQRGMWAVSRPGRIESSTTNPSLIQPGIIEARSSTPCRTTLP